VLLPCNGCPALPLIYPRSCAADGNTPPSGRSMASDGPVWMCKSRGSQASLPAGCCSLLSAIPGLGLSLETNRYSQRNRLLCTLLPNPPCVRFHRHTPNSPCAPQDRSLVIQEALHWHRCSTARLGTREVLCWTAAMSQEGRIKQVSRDAA
jgi:hypothetical protein